MSGVIRVKADTTVQTGAWSLIGGASSFIDIANGETVGYATTDAAIAAYEFDASSFSSGVELDGIPTLINDLPLGFHITGLKIQVNLLISNNGFISLFQLIHDLTVLYDNAAISNGFHTPLEGTIVAATLDFLSLFGGNWSVKATLNNAAGQVEISYLNLLGAYDIESWVTGIPDVGPYAAGDNVEITGLSNLNGVAEVHVTFDDQECIIAAASFVSQSATSIIFTLTAGCLGSFVGTVNVSIKGNGVQFSGYVMVGTLEILLENATGLYTLVRNKTNDTLYDRSAPGETIDVKIPNPFIKTSYIGG